MSVICDGTSRAVSRRDVFNVEEMIMTVMKMSLILAHQQQLRLLVLSRLLLLLQLLLLPAVVLRLLKNKKVVQPHEEGK